MRHLRTPALRLVVAIGVAALSGAPIAAQFCMTMVLDNTAPTKKFSVTAMNEAMCPGMFSFSQQMSQSAVCFGGTMAMATHLTGSGALSPMCTFTGLLSLYPRLRVHRLCPHLHR